MWRLSRLVPVALALAAACTGNGTTSATTSATTSRESPRCQTSFSAPAGFEQVESFEQRYPDRVGVRLGYRDAGKRELHVFAGIPGEFGEGLPDAGEIQVSGGLRGRLLGGGSVWVLVWSSQGPCAPHAVLGNGFGRREFLLALKEAGVLPA